MKKSRLLYAIMSIALAAHLSGCALGWFGAGAATGAVVEHERHT